MTRGNKRATSGLNPRHGCGLLLKFFGNFLGTIGIFKEKCSYAAPLHPINPSFWRTSPQKSTHLPSKCDVIPYTSSLARFVFSTFFPFTQNFVQPYSCSTFNTPSDSRPHSPQMSSAVHTPIACETSTKNASQVGGVVRFWCHSHHRWRVPGAHCLQNFSPIRARTRALERFSDMKGWFVPSPEIHKTFFCSFSLRNAPNVDVLVFIRFRIARWALLSQSPSCGSYGETRENRKILKIAVSCGSCSDSYCSFFVGLVLLHRE